MKLEEPTSPISERISFRPVLMPDDEPFLQKLYASTRDDLNKCVTNESQLRELLVMQYNGQKATYAAAFPDASHDILLLDFEPVGRLIVDRQPGAIHGVDLALLPRARNMGIGTSVMRGLFEECQKQNLPFVFHVLKTNPAQRLYERLGCSFRGDDATHFRMEWRAESSIDL